MEITNRLKAASGSTALFTFSLFNRILRDTLVYIASLPNTEGGALPAHSIIQDFKVNTSHEKR